LIEINGGIYTPELHKNCTHLICESPEGLKFEHGWRWGVLCVSKDWLLHSIRLQVPLDEDFFLLEALKQKGFSLLEKNSTYQKLIFKTFLVFLVN
jgi:hypothetical protein